MTPTPLPQVLAPEPSALADLRKLIQEMRMATIDAPAMGRYSIDVEDILTAHENHRDAVIDTIEAFAVMDQIEQLWGDILSGAHTLETGEEAMAHYWHRLAYVKERFYDAVGVVDEATVEVPPPYTDFPKHGGRSGGGW